MDDKKQELLEQFDFPIYHMYRTRGAFLLETSHGLRLLRIYTGSIARLEFEDCLKNNLVSLGFPSVDTYVKNKDGGLICTDSYYDKYICKNWFEGEECNLKSTDKTVLAVQNLAELHKKMHLNPIPRMVEKLPDGIENLNINKQNQTVLQDYRNCPGNLQKNLKEVFRKRTRELERVRCYLRDKHQKSNFEVFYLGICNTFYNQALSAARMMEESGYQQLFEEALATCLVCHGNYTQHNVILNTGGIATLNFEKAVFGIQITDLYHFLRKTMEKNNWDIKLGIRLIREYNERKPISDEELNLLYLLLYYPEKFWKITNSYYNSKKSWIPQKNLQKLIAVQEQAPQKLKFLEQMEQLNLSL